MTVTVACTCLRCRELHKVDEELHAIGPSATQEDMLCDFCRVYAWCRQARDAHAYDFAFDAGLFTHARGDS